MPILISEREQCEAVRAEWWIETPHNWTRCKKAVHEVRDGLPVCSNHARADVFVRFDTPEESRPSWRDWYS